MHLVEPTLLSSLLCDRVLVYDHANLKGDGTPNPVWTRPWARVLTAARSGYMTFGKGTRIYERRGGLRRGEGAGSERRGKGSNSSRQLPPRVTIPPLAVPLPGTPPGSQYSSARVGGRPASAGAGRTTKLGNKRSGPPLGLRRHGTAGERASYGDGLSATPSYQNYPRSHHTATHSQHSHLLPPARTIRNILPAVPARALLVITQATLRCRAVTTLRRALVGQRRCHREQKGSVWAGSGWGVRCWGEAMGLRGRKVGSRGKGRDGWKVLVVDPKRFAPFPR